MFITVDVFTKKFLEQFPEYQPFYLDHIEFNGELLPHVFFGETLNEDLPAIINSENEEKLRRIFDFMEFMIKEGDPKVQEVIALTILARLGDEAERWKKSLKYMGPKTRKASEEIETFWGRK